MWVEYGPSLPYGCSRSRAPYQVGLVLGLCDSHLKIVLILGCIENFKTHFSFYPKAIFVNE